MLAPAKINLALHVTGRRADGYHLLDTLVAFADIGDRLTIEPDSAVSITIDGPFAAALADTVPEDNLVLRAFSRIAALADPAPGARFRLEKHLPVAAGLGGGSSDAAAALRLAVHLAGLEVDLPALNRIALSLGADVPMCLARRPLRARGTGEEISALAPLPDAGLLLVNPGATLATPAVFRALAGKCAPSLPADLPRFASPAELAAFLRTTRNDLAQPAIALLPEIAEVLARLDRLPGTLFAQMSGSGATCFALFASREAARHAALSLSLSLSPARHCWWVRAGGFLMPAE